MRKILPIGKRNFVGKKFKSAKPNELNVSDKNVIKNNINKYTHQQLAIRIGKPVAAVEKFIKKEKLVSTLVIEDTNDLVVVEQISKPIEAKSPQNDAIKQPKVSQKKERKVIEKSLQKENFIRENHRKYTTNELANELNITSEGVRLYLRKLKLTAIKVSLITPKPKNEKENFIRENHEKYTIHELANELNITSEGVKFYLRKLKLTAIKVSLITPKPKNEKEDFIRENHEKYTLDELANQLHCTTKNVRYYLKKLNLTPRKSYQSEIRSEAATRKMDFIKENYQKYDINGLIKEMRSSSKTVREYLKKLELTPFKKNQSKEYSPEVIDFLRTNYRTMTAREMSDSLGSISWNTTRYLCGKLGFIKTPEEVKAVKLGWNKAVFTPEEEKYIIENHGNIALALIAINLKRTRSSVINFLRREGRKITKEQYQIIKRNMSEIAQEAKRKANT